MSEIRCSRAWQAEAIEDGRLEGSERASFERHAEGCADCMKELTELKRLRTLLGAVPHPGWAPLERRRQRLALLSEANQRTTRRPGRTSTWLLAALVPLAVVAVMLVLKARRPETPVALGPEFEVSAQQGARWQTEERGEQTLARLFDGTLKLHVHKLKPEQRFVLELPDGNLEVRGTRFTVVAEHGRTVSVSVSEGAVALSVAGVQGLLLRAGDHWSAAGKRTASVDAANRPAPDKPVAPAPEPNRPTRLQETSSTTASVPASDSTASGGRTGTAAGRAFASAMHAFESGNNESAERLFHEFLAKYPGDGRSEDAMFLSAVLRARQGDRAGAARWAKRYLTTYPSGLRRREATALAGAGQAEGE